MAFENGFLWGVAGAAPQQEGGCLDGGKGLSIWDALCEGHIKNNDTPHVSCDHYNRWREDVELLKEMGVNSYRFSVSLARIFPDDDTTVNEEGVRFYTDLVTRLKELNIEPVCTLYHWDMPLWLHRRGGWKNEQTVEWFERFTKIIVDALSDKVSYWITFNEPQVFIGLGYKDGVHAPFEKVPDSEIKLMSKNVMLAHGRAVRVIRQFAKIKPKIGFATTAGITVPTENKDENQAYEYTFDGARNGVFNTSWWADPMALGKRFKGCDWLSDNDLKNIYEPLDFFAYNIYYAENWGDGFELAYSGMPRTTMGWMITPLCMYWAAKFLYKRYGLPLFLSENGMANSDFVFEDGRVHDPQRIEFLHLYLRELRRATDGGVPVIGYLYWSFLDNFEWAEGYFQRFGLVHVDYRTQKRTLKDSAYEYKKIIETNGKNL